MKRLLSFSLGLWLLCVACCPAQAQEQGGSSTSPVDELVKVETLTSVESRRQALVTLSAAADRQRQAGDVAALVRALNKTSEIQLKLNDPDSAFSSAEEALALARQSTNKLLVDTLNLNASVQRYRQDNKSALSRLNEARTLSLGLNYRLGEAQSLMETGVVYLQQSELVKAEASEKEALQIWRELGDRQGEARALFNLGEAYMRLDKSRQAAEELESALAIWRELGNPTEQASTLIDLNFLSIRQGQWQKSLALLSEASALIKDKEAEPFIAGQIAMSLGEAYEAYAQLEIALRYFEEGLSLYRDSARDPLAAIDAGRKVAHVKARLGDYQKAVQEIEEGLRLAREIDNRFVAALCHEDLGRVHLVAGLPEPAKKEFLQAIAGYQPSVNRREWARAQTFLGQTAYVQGDKVLAATSYRKALQVYQEIEDYTNEAALCFGLGKLELEEQKLEEAERYLKRSIALTEQLRENAASKDLRSSFLASVHDRYETYVEWLMQLHAARPNEQFDVAAFEASELGRARSLLDSLKDYQRELRRAADPLLLIEEEKVQKQEQQLLDKRAKLLSQGGTPEDREKIEAELMRVHTQYETLEAQINSTAKFNNLLRQEPLSLADIKKQITDSETALLEYSLGSRKSYLWVVTREGFASYELPDKNTIEQAVRKLSGLLVKPEPDAAHENELQEAIAEVSRIVLGPVATNPNTRRLIVVADGALQYIPFQILTMPSNANDPLVARYEIINAPSASALSVVQREAVNRPAAPKLLAAFGDPAFSSNYALKTTPADRGQEREAPNGNDNQLNSEERLQETLDPGKVQSLFYAGRELNELRKLIRPDDSIIYSGIDATRDNLRSLDLSQYRILHFATHGFLNARQPELSGLVLSLVDRQGRPVSGFVSLSDIYNLRANVDLVVLSACRTALGKDMRGEGLVGLTRGFMYAGASSVVASLWKVDDEATAELMKRFYSNMLQGGMPPAEALRAAQNSIRQEKNWRSPYYWAAFTLQGEYRQVIKPTPAAAPAGLSRKLMAAAALLLSALIAVCWYYRRRRGATARARK